VYPWQVGSTWTFLSPFPEWDPVLPFATGGPPVAVAGAALTGNGGWPEVYFSLMWALDWVGPEIGWRGQALFDS
jgi:hypothetical protein